MEEIRRIVALSLSLMIVTTACGRLNESEQTLADAIAQAILDEDAGVANPVVPSEAVCIGENTVRRIGVEGLGEIGVTQMNPTFQSAFPIATDEQIDAIVDVYFECIDIGELFVEGMTQGGNLSSESVECLTDELLDEDVVREFVRAAARGEDFEEMFTADPEIGVQFLEIVLACLSPEELVDFGGG